jgi:hypothetical protein
MTSPPPETPSQLPTTSLARTCMASSLMFMVLNLLIKKINLLNFLDWYKQDQPRQNWILGGDFNLITNLWEKKGGCRTLTQEDTSFKNFIENNELVDLEPTNGIYTWNN